MLVVVLPVVMLLMPPDPAVRLTVGAVNVPVLVIPAEEALRVNDEAAILPSDTVVVALSVMLSVAARCPE